MEDDVGSSGMREGYLVWKSLLLLIFFGRGGCTEISGMQLECSWNRCSLNGI